MANEIKLKAIVVTVSDTRTESEDVSGVTLVGLLLANGAEIVDKIIVSDDFEDLRNTLYSFDRARGREFNNHDRRNGFCAAR